MKLRNGFTCLLLVGVLWGFGSCHSSTNPDDSENLKVGVILPMTGRLGQMGVVEKNAIELALDDLKKENIHVKVIFEDGKGDNKEVASSTQKLLNIDKVDVLFTSTTSASLTAEPIATASKTNLVAFCMDPTIADKSDYVIRLYEGIYEESNALLGYFDELNDSSVVGLIYTRVPVFEKVVENRYLPYFDSLNIPVQYVESYPLQENDFRTLVLKLKGAGVTDLIVLGYGFEYPKMFKELAQQNVLNQINILGGWGFLYTDVEKSLLEDVYVSGPRYVFEDKNEAIGFKNRYQRMFGTEPNFDAAFAYNAFMLLGKISVDKYDRPLKTTLSNIDSLSGVIGSFKISENGELIVETTLGQIKSGRIVEVTK